MTTPAHRIHYTLSEYLALEASSNVKHEYFDGQIYAMAGGTPEHAALSAALIGLMFPQLRGGRCRIYDADLRIRVNATGLTTYPDITVVCGPREPCPNDPHAITNPTLIAEVLSPSTEAYDRGDKFEHYQCLPSLQQYVLVSHRERTIEVWNRTSNGTFVPRISTEGEIVHFDAIGVQINVRELFDSASEPAS